MELFDISKLKIDDKPVVVIIDGIKGLCSIGYFNTWSLRIKIEFLNKHPVLGKIFMTKYFNMKNPGYLEWGYKNNIMTIYKM